PVAKPYTGTPKAAQITVLGGSNSTVNPGPDDVPQSSFLPTNSTRYELDFGAARPLGGLALRWAAGDALPKAYEIQFSDGPVPSPWRTVATVKNRRTATHLIQLPDEQCNRLAIVVTGFASALPALLEKVEVLDSAVVDNPNTVAHEAAARARLGVYPKATRGETQSNWTVLGAAGDAGEAMINEEGQIELGKSLASIEPFVVGQAGELLTWADASHTQSLSEGCLPIVTITRTYANGLELVTTAVVAGAPGRSTLMTRYKLTGKTPLGLTRLVLATRPFQVNPPWQFLNESGGVARVSEAQVDGTAGKPTSRMVLTMPTTDGAIRRTLRAFPPAAFGFASDAARGDLVEQLDTPGFEPSSLQTLARCEQNRASAALVFSTNTKDPNSIDVVIAVPMGEAMDSTLASALDAAPTKAFADQLEQTRSFWHDKLYKVKFKVPAQAQTLIDAARSQIAYIHINRDGPGIQPGSRSYERSWIRDGSMTAMALLEFGQIDEAKAFVEWYAKYQFESGRVPCVVDSRGPDPVPENDSHGQLIFAIASVYRYTGDREFLARMEPHVHRAMTAIGNLLAERTTPKYASDELLTERQQPGKPGVPARAFQGLMPESISHEGYSAVPMHSHWDNFFTLRGIRDAQFVATARSDPERARRYK
ncbi:MAG: hypothetical protein ACOYPS_14255, partial [Phycisphaerales bacterium]